MINSKVERNEKAKMADRKPEESKRKWLIENQRKVR